MSVKLLNQRCVEFPVPIFFSFAFLQHCLRITIHYDKLCLKRLPRDCDKLITLHFLNCWCWKDETDFPARWSITFIYCIYNFNFIITVINIISIIFTILVIFIIYNNIIIILSLVTQISPKDKRSRKNSQPTNYSQEK